MPAVVAQRRKPGVFACSFCHLLNDIGQLENISLTGLPEVCIMRQLADMRSGARKNSVASTNPQTNMVSNAFNLAEAELDAAARYVALLPARSFVSVLESAQVPTTVPRSWMLLPMAAGVMKSSGQRITELAQDAKPVAMRDPDVHCVAPAPPGCIVQRRHLAADSSRRPSCTACHGTDLRGVGDIPRLAGRSPSYLLRQMIDFATGARRCALAAPMLEGMKQFGDAERMALAAYAASLPPQFMCSSVE